MNIILYYEPNYEENTDMPNTKNLRRKNKTLELTSWVRVCGSAGRRTRSLCMAFSANRLSRMDSSGGGVKVENYETKKFWSIFNGKLHNRSVKHYHCHCTYDEALQTLILLYADDEAIVETRRRRSDWQKCVTCSKAPMKVPNVGSQTCIRDNCSTERVKHMIYTDDIIASPNSIFKHGLQ